MSIDSKRFNSQKVYFESSETIKDACDILIVTILQEFFENRLIHNFQFIINIFCIFIFIYCHFDKLLR